MKKDRSICECGRQKTGYKHTKRYVSKITGEVKEYHTTILICGKCQYKKNVFRSAMNPQLAA